MDEASSTVRIITRSNRGQWENHVDAHPDLSQSFASREEAIAAGAALAAERGFRHVVEPAEPTGAITVPGTEAETGATDGNGRSGHRRSVSLKAGSHP